MKTVRVLGDDQVEVVDLPEPEPHDDFVVVKVMSSSICGTERHTYNHGLPVGAASAGVMNGGHEATGVVWKAMRASPLREGDRINLFSAMAHCGRCLHCASGRWVLCEGERPPPGTGYHAQFVLKRQDFCLPLADDIDFDTGALLTDVMGTAYHAVQRARISASDTVLVMGQGPVGLAATMICKFLGATVITGDVNPTRLELSRACGADATVTPGEDVVEKIRAAAGSRGVDAAIDCAGAQESRVTCLQAVRRGGRVALVGLADGLNLDRATFTQHMFLKDLDLIASWYSDPNDVFELQHLVRRGLDPKRMVSHILPIGQATEGFSAMFGGHGGKVILRPWPDETIS